MFHCFRRRPKGDRETGRKRIILTTNSDVVGGADSLPLYNNYILRLSQMRLVRGIVFAAKKKDGEKNTKKEKFCLHLRLLKMVVKHIKTQCKTKNNQLIVDCQQLVFTYYAF